MAQGQRPDPSLLASAYYCHAVRNALVHPLLPAQQLIRSLHELAARLPNYEAEALAAAIDERASQAHCPPEGGGWIASQPRTRPSRPATVSLRDVETQPGQMLHASY